MAEHIVGKTSDIDEGTGKTFTIEGQTIAVFNKGGEIFAIEDTCKHKGGSLGKGELDGDTITCLFYLRPLTKLPYLFLTYQLLFIYHFIFSQNHLLGLENS